MRGLAHFPEVTWDRVEQARAHFRPWTIKALRLETDARTPAELVARALAYIQDPDA